MRGRRHLSSWAVFLIALAWAPFAIASDTLRPSDLNRNPQKYDQKEVVIEGVLLFNTPNSNHSYAIYDSINQWRWHGFLWRLGLVDNEKRPDKKCLDIDNPNFVYDNIEKPRYKHVKLKGVYLAPNGYRTVFELCGINALFGVEEILDVR